MDRQTILIIGDDVDTPRELEDALEPLGCHVVTVSETKALERCDNGELSVIVLDLAGPTTNGFHVLEQIEQERPDLPVIMLVPPSAVRFAVEGMKHGVLDVIEIPFAPEHVRDVVREWLDPTRRDAVRQTRYKDHVGAARSRIRQGALDAALAHLRQAVAARLDGPEAHNLIGVVEDLRHQRTLAQAHYRFALSLAPWYNPARDNLFRSTSAPEGRGPLALGDGSL